MDSKVQKHFYKFASFSEPLLAGTRHLLCYIITYITDISHCTASRDFFTKRILVCISNHWRPYILNWISFHHRSIVIAPQLNLSCFVLGYLAAESHAIEGAVQFVHWIPLNWIRLGISLFTLW